MLDNVYSIGKKKRCIVWLIQTTIFYALNIHNLKVIIIAGGIQLFFFALSKTLEARGPSRNIMGLMGEAG